MNAFDLEQAAKSHGDVAAFLDDEGGLSYRELYREVLYRSVTLRDRGIDCDPDAPPVACSGAPTRKSAVTLLALMNLGVRALPLHPKWTAAERQQLLDAVPVQTVIEDGAEAAATLRAHCRVPSPAPGQGHWQLLVPTGGSTGEPRLISLGADALEHSARSVWARLGQHPQDRWLLDLPLAHIAGVAVLLRCLAARRTVVFSAGGTVEASLLEERGVSLVSWVPTQLTRFLERQRPEELPQLRCIMLGGAAASPALLQRAREARLPLATTYGLTEACGTVTLERPGRRARTKGAGQALNGVELRVDEQGVIQVRGPTLARGQYRGQVEPLPLQDGWFTTGDRGHLEGETLVVEGRVSECIVTGGENVYPTEVEAALEADPDVAAACVFPLADALWGEVVCAAIVPRDAALDLSALDRRIEARLAPFKRPRRYALVNSLPETATGKVDRRAVIRRVAAGEIEVAASGPVHQRHESV